MDKYNHQKMIYCNYQTCVHPFLEETTPNSFYLPLLTDIPIEIWLCLEFAGISYS